MSEVIRPAINHTSPYTLVCTTRSNRRMPCYLHTHYYGELVGRVQKYWNWLSNVAGKAAQAYWRWLGAKLWLTERGRKWFTALAALFIFGTVSVRFSDTHGEPEPTVVEMLLFTGTVLVIVVGLDAACRGIRYLARHLTGRTP